MMAGRRAYNPVLNSKAPIVLIDTVNAFFAWYYATVRIIGKRAPAKPSNIEVGALKAAFETTFRRRINRILMFTKTEARNIILATDCPRRNVWRHDIIRTKEHKVENYKSRRAITPDSRIPVLMQFMYDDLIPRLLPNQRIGVARAEADDVIGVITRLVQARSPQRLIYIISDDSDFLQLLDHDQTHILSQSMRSMRDKYPRCGRVYKALKILQGDRMDTIKPAFPRCGPKTAETLLKNPDLLEQKFEKYGRSQFDLNTKLIDFDHIPPEIRSKILEKVLLLNSHTPADANANANTGAEDREATPPVPHASI